MSFYAEENLKNTDFLSILINHINHHSMQPTMVHLSSAHSDLKKKLINSSLTAKNINKMKRCVTIKIQQYYFTGFQQTALRLVCMQTHTKKILKQHLRRLFGISFSNIKFFIFETGVYSPHLCLTKFMQFRIMQHYVCRI